MQNEATDISRKTKLPTCSCCDNVEWMAQLPTVQPDQLKLHLHNFAENSMFFFSSNKNPVDAEIILFSWNESMS